jgi:hypothetical protein
MPWHTVDGIFIGITAIWMTNHVFSNHKIDNNKWFIIWALAGFAPLIKQGFLIIPVLIALSAIMETKKKTLQSFPVVFLPCILYAFWTRGVVGGLKNNLYSGSSSELLRPFSQIQKVLESNVGIYTTLILITVLIVIHLTKINSIKIIILWLLVLVPIIHIMLRENFGLSVNWDWIILIQFIILSLVITKNKNDFIKITSILGLAFASAMSWGVPGPGLIAGTMLAISLVIFVTQLQEHNNIEVRYVLNTVLIITLTLISLTSTYVRDRIIYRESPKVALRFESSEPKLKFIRMSKQSAAFVDSIL